MKITTEKRCGCRDESGKKYPRGKCPRLAKRTHGAWAWRFRVPKELVPLVGKPELSGSGFATKKEAEDDAGTAVAKIRAGQRATGGLKVGDYLDQWLEGKRKLRPTARRSYAGHIRVHLKPLLGELPLDGLQAHHISKAYRKIEESNAAKRRPTGPATIARVHATLKNALNDAVDQRLIGFSPAHGVELPDHEQPEIEPWEADEVGMFLDEASSDRHAAMWELIALHGVRRGEACGCAWPGLDDEASVLTISQQITGDAGNIGIWAPKTKSGRRKIDLDATTLGSLLAHKIQQDAERELAGPGWDNGTLPDEHGNPVKLSGLMFTRPDGRYLRPNYVSRRMQQIAKKAGLLATIRLDAPAGATEVVVSNRWREPTGTWTLYHDREPVVEITVTAVTTMRGTRARLHLAEPLPVDVAVGDEIGRNLLSRRRLHDLRHSSASIQLAEGVDLALVSKRMGHSNTVITGNLYVHLLRSAGKRAAEAVASAVPRAQRSAGTLRAPGAFRPSGVTPGGTRGPVSHVP